MNPLILAPLALAGYLIASSALHMSADMLNAASTALRSISQGKPPEPTINPGERVEQFLDEIADPLKTLESAEPSDIE